MTALARSQVPDCPAHFRAWIEEMANYVKKLDPSHLVSIGEEGFFGQERPEAVHNPADWGGQIGQDFVLDHMPAAIDFATVHTWPDNWQRWGSADRVWDHRLINKQCTCSEQFQRAAQHILSGCK